MSAWPSSGGASLGRRRSSLAFCQQYDRTGTLVSTLDTGTASAEETGSCFAPTGEFYQTNFQDGSIRNSPADRSLESSRWATVSGSPESCVVGSDGSVYVGVVDPGSLVQFSSDGTVVNTFAIKNAPVSGGLLVACSSEVVLLDSSGNITQTRASHS